MNIEIIKNNMNTIFDKIDLLTSQLIEILTKEINLYSEDLTIEKIKNIRFNNEKLIIGIKEHNKINHYNYLGIKKEFKNKNVIVLLDFLYNSFFNEFYDSSYYFKSINNKPLLFVNLDL